MSILRFLGSAPSRIDREIFDADLRRVVKVGWLIIAISTAINIAFLPGGVKFWQPIAISIIIGAFLLALFIERITKSALAYATVPATLLILPVVFASESQAPWLAYGLVIVPAIIHSTAFEDSRISIAIIYLLILVQYVVSKLNFQSISDNVDNQLLSSYFATSWSFIVGIGAIAIRRSYLKYYDQIELSVEKVKARHLTEAQKISNLNLQDHLNGQLHGTVLNTLIAIRNAPNLLSNREEIKRFLQKDLLLLDQVDVTPSHDLESILRSEAFSSQHRELDVTFDLRIDSSLDPLIYEVTREIVRELLLNIRKHSLATQCAVVIDLSERPMSSEIETSVIVRQLSITVTDDSPVQAKLNKKDLSADFRSESIARLMKSVDGDFSLHSEKNQLNQRITFDVPERHETYLQNVTTLRQEAVKYLAKGFIFLTLLYAIVSLPGYLYLGIASDVALLFGLQILFLAASFGLKGAALPLAGIGSFTAISIFPLISLKTIACQDIQYLPWVFNGILGSAFFVTLLVKSNVLKWLPLILFLASSLIIQEKLPSACKNLLAGSIPAIILIFFIAIGFTIARNKAKRAQEIFIAQSLSDYKGIESTKKLVVFERKKIIQELRDFVSRIDSNEFKDAEISKRINLLILSLRTFLLTSEYFNSFFVFSLYNYAISRNLAGIETKLEINTNDFTLDISKREVDRMFLQLGETTRGVSLAIEISRNELAQLIVTLKTNEKVDPLVLQQGNLKIQLIQD